MMKNVTINCTSSSMSFLIRKDYLGVHSARELSLNNLSCQPTESDNVLSMSWSLSECANVITHSANMVRMDLIPINELIIILLAIKNRWISRYSFLNIGMFSSARVDVRFLNWGEEALLLELQLTLILFGQQVWILEKCILCCWFNGTAKAAREARELIAKAYPPYFIDLLGFRHTQKNRRL